MQPRATSIALRRPPGAKIFKALAGHMGGYVRSDGACNSRRSGRTRPSGWMHSDPIRGIRRQERLGSLRLLLAVAGHLSNQRGIRRRTIAAAAFVDGATHAVIFCSQLPTDRPSYRMDFCHHATPTTNARARSHPALSSPPPFSSFRPRKFNAKLLHRKRNVLFFPSLSPPQTSRPPSSSVTASEAASVKDRPAGHLAIQPACA